MTSVENGEKIQIIFTALIVHVQYDSDVLKILYLSLTYSQSMELEVWGLCLEFDRFSKHNETFCSVLQLDVA